MLIDNKFDIGDKLYIITDDEQKERMINGIQINPHGIIYRLGCGINDTWHYDFELNKEKNIIKCLTDGAIDE